MDADEALTVIRDVARGAYDGLMQGQHELKLERSTGESGASSPMAAIQGMRC